MFDNAQMLDLIERALEDDPFCPVCGAPTTIEDDQAVSGWSAPRRRCRVACSAASVQ
jgi:hypothetical protein